MFTGIVQALGTVVAAAETGAGRRLTVGLGELAREKIMPGDSVCVSGVCLTVTTVGKGRASFDVITETLRRTSLGGKRVGDRVNLELSLRSDSFVGGHFVQGHVDALGTVREIQAKTEDWRITFGMQNVKGELQNEGAARGSVGDGGDMDVMACIVPKGSVAVDGVSMTIAEVGRGGGRTFTLAVIPTTLERTTLGALKVGDVVNVETDILARTVVHYLRMATGAVGGSGQPEGVTLQRLAEAGFA